MPTWKTSGQDVAQCLHWVGSRHPFKGWNEFGKWILWNPGVFNTCPEAGISQHCLMWILSSSSHPEALSLETLSHIISTVPWAMPTYASPLMGRCGNIYCNVTRKKKHCLPFSISLYLCAPQKSPTTASMKCLPFFYLFFKVYCYSFFLQEEFPDSLNLQQLIFSMTVAQHCPNHLTLNHTLSSDTSWMPLVIL